MDMSNVIKTRVMGIDIGVSNTSIAIVDLRGTILAQDTLRTSDFPSVNNFVEAEDVRLSFGEQLRGGS